MGLRGREGRRCKEEGRRDGEKEWRIKAVMDCISKVGSLFIKDEH